MLIECTPTELEPELEPQTGTHNWNPELELELVPVQGSNPPPKIAK